MSVSDAMFSGDLVRRIEKLEALVDDLTGGRRLEDSGVSRGGATWRGGALTAYDQLGRLIFQVDSDAAQILMNLINGELSINGGRLVLNGGQFRALYPSGNTGAFFGPLISTPTGESTGHGMLIQTDADGSDIFRAVERPDGTREVLVGGTGDSVDSFRLWARGHQLVSTDAEGGLAKPYLNIPMYPSTGTSVGTGGPFWPEFVNSSYQEVMHGITTLWHPRIRIGVATSTPGGGTVEWELRVDGDTIASASGSTFATGDVPSWNSGTTPGDQRSVQLWCRNTSGAASRVTTDYCYGLES